MERKQWQEKEIKTQELETGMITVKTGKKYTERKRNEKRGILKMSSKKEQKGSLAVPHAGDLLEAIQSTGADKIKGECK